MVEKLTPRQKKDIKELFEGFDKDNNGSLSEDEVRTGLFNFGCNPTKKDVEDILKELNIKKGKIFFDQFQKAMAKYFLAHTDPRKELENAFAMFDKDKSGYVDVKELKFALTHLGEKLKRKDVDKLFNEMDANKDGKLDYKELAVLLSAKDYCKGQHKK